MRRHSAEKNVEAIILLTVEILRIPGKFTLPTLSHRTAIALLKSSRRSC